MLVNKKKPKSHTKGAACAAPFAWLYTQGGDSPYIENHTPAMVGVWFAWLLAGRVGHISFVALCLHRAGVAHVVLAYFVWQGMDFGWVVHIMGSERLGQ